MAFAPRTYEECRDDMINYVRMHTALTDFEVGSVIRTLIEAAALEDDEQYFQMVQLLDAFRLSTATGQDLDERVAEYGIIRLQPESSTGYIVFRDGALATNTLKYAESSGATTITLTSSVAFPASSFNVRIGEGTLNVEDIAVTTNNTGTGVLAVPSGCANVHSAGERCSVVSGASDRTLVSGVRVQVPASGTTPAFVFVTVEGGTLLNGNYTSTQIQVRAEVQGSNGNVGSGEITEFTSSTPFTGCLVTNTAATAGGRDVEMDAQLRDRARRQIQSLAKTTKLAIQQSALGVSDPVTGQRVVTASVYESFVNNEVILYVDDGTGFTPDTVQLASTTTPGVLGGVLTLTVVDSSAFPKAGWLVIGTSTPSLTEFIEFTSVNYTTNVITLATATAGAHGAVDVSVIDMVDDSAEPGTNFFQLANFPVVRDSCRIWYKETTSTAELLVEDVDYVLNRGTGQIELIGAGAASGAILAAHYEYYTALIKQVQTVIDGDPKDPTTYPGVRAAGIRVVVETPSIRRINVNVSITAEPGVQESDISSTVQEAIESYIGALGIGEDVIKSEIIRRAMNVDGVLDANVLIPTTNVVILENEIARAVDSTGVSLVTVN